MELVDGDVSVGATGGEVPLFTMTSSEVPQVRTYISTLEQNYMTDCVHTYVVVDYAMHARHSVE